MLCKCLTCDLTLNIMTLKLSEFYTFLVYTHLILLFQTPQNTTSKSASTSSSPQPKVTTTSPTSPAYTTNKSEPKPVECNLCHRKFKNIPALNGHMRLHGGYFKKDAENKKSEKKDTSGPPLQTASVSVRALIEEKIINKRITNPPTPAPEDPPRSAAPPLFPLNVHSSTDAENAKVSSFVVPAPPAAEKARRHSDAETFTRPSSAQQEAEAIADLILKREKVGVKVCFSPYFAYALCCILASLIDWILRRSFFV